LFNQKPRTEVGGRKQFCSKLVVEEDRGDPPFHIPISKGFGVQREFIGEKLEVQKDNRQEVQA
jgi:hypothetical protein